METQRKKKKKNLGVKVLLLFIPAFKNEENALDDKEDDIFTMQDLLQIHSQCSYKR